MQRSIRSALVVLALVAAFFAGQAVAGQPRMQAALEHLQSARLNLQKAEGAKGGHRARAIALVDEAIAEVKLGIRFERNN